MKRSATAVSPMDKLFDTIDKAPVSGSGNYFTAHGDYLLEIKKVKIQNGIKGTCSIIEVEVLTSRKLGPEEPHPAGFVGSTVYNFDKHVTSAGNFKKFLLAVIGKEAEEVDSTELKAVWDEVTGEDQPLVGHRIGGKTRHHTTQKGVQMLILDWYHVEQE